MPLRKIILIMYLWVYKFFQDHIMRDVEISKKTVVDWFSFCREVCVKIVIKQHEAQPEKTVEIDESLFNKRKYNKGKKKVCQQWVFSGAEQGSNKCFLANVDKRDARTLIYTHLKECAARSYHLGSFSVRSPHGLKRWFSD
ncbi:Wilms tumor protein 1-interacting protein-like protein [Frankliniella fusca]|uniref:Wilms tumor protein 1-interacting protein-like protein n=1 Tax=Frankliniella fusca TaxID=407009 RepID=A0AAE1GZ02_9NEOP|nr:Wilms tumor protein 1-interacting protein-like protein [Frankliniella fusca]